MDSVERVVRVECKIHALGYGVSELILLRIVEVLNMSWSQPLANDQDVHPHEEVPKNEDLWNEFE